MIKNKFIVLAIVAVFGLLLTTPIAKAQASKRKQRTAPKKTSVVRSTNKSTIPDLDLEAAREFLKVWSQRFTNCGDSFIERVSGKRKGTPVEAIGDIHQHKGELSIDRIALTEADMLNGVEYLAQPSFKWRVHRVWTNSSGTWSPWEVNKNPENRMFLSQVRVRKMNGQWQVYWTVENSYQFEQWVADYPPPPCSVLQD